MAGKKNKSAAKREAVRRAAQLLRREERARRRALALSQSGKSPCCSPKAAEVSGPGRVFLFFAAVFALVLLLESERVAVFMDSLAPSPLVEKCASLARSLGEISGLAALTAREDALVLALADKSRIGAEKAAAVPPAASDIPAGPPPAASDIPAGPPPAVSAVAPQSLPSGQTLEFLLRNANEALILLEPAPEAQAPDLHLERERALRAETARETPELLVGETGSTAGEAMESGRKQEASAGEEVSPSGTPASQQGLKASAGGKAVAAGEPSPGRKPKASAREEVSPSEASVSQQGLKASAGGKAVTAGAPSPGRKPKASAKEEVSPSEASVSQQGLKASAGGKAVAAGASSPGRKPKASAGAEVSPSGAAVSGKSAGFVTAPRSLPAPAPPVVSGTVKNGEKVVLLVGDSMMGWGLGHVLERTLNRRPGIRAVRDTRPSTGLASANPFNWPGHLNELVARHSPNLVVIFIGANDGCNIVDQARKRHIVGTPSWDDAYRQRAGNFLRIAQSGGAKVIWLGLPIVGAERFSGILRRVSLLQQAACEDNGQALFIDNYRTLADSEGKYSTFLTNKSNKPVRVRAKDKIHITTEGGGILTEFVLPSILNALAPLPPLAAARAVHE